MLRELLHGMRLRLRALVHRRRLDRDLEDELAFHLAMRADAYRAAGMAPGSAEAAARRRFGNAFGLRETCRQLWSLNRVERLVQDLRYGARMLRRTPGFTAVVVLTLTLGIGAITTVFSLLELRPLPVPHPEQLVFLHWTTVKPASWHTVGYVEGCEDLHAVRVFDCVVPYGLYQRVDEQTRSLSGIAAFTAATEVQVRVHDEPTLAKVQFTSGNYFSVLGVGPALGRTLVAADDQAGAAAVAVLSHRYWVERFGGDAAVVGRTVSVNGTPMTVVGVTPDTFFGLDATKVPAMWIPVHAGAQLRESPPGLLNKLLDDQTGLLGAIGRLKPGTTVREANAELSAVQHQVLAEGRDFAIKLENQPGIVVTPAPFGVNALRATYGGSLRLLRGLVVLVLVVVCANIANLLLARASVRRREIAVRLALGAGRDRLLAQMIAEGLLLSVLGSAGGLVVGLWGSTIVAALLVPGIETAAFAWSRPSASILGLVVGLSAVTTLIFGLVPAWAAWRVMPSRDLQTGGLGSKGAVGSRVGRFIVAGEVAVALVLLVGAGLLVRTVVNLVTFDPGFRTDHLLTVGVSSVVGQGPAAADAAPVGALRDRLAALPGVTSATWSSQPLLGNRKAMCALLLGDEPNVRVEMVDYMEVGPRFFATVEMPLLAGREVAESDMPKDVPGVWVNRSFVERFLPGRQAVGAAVRLSMGHAQSEVAGVVGDARSFSIHTDASPMVYFPRAQAGYYLLRTAIDPLAVADGARAAVRSTSPGLLVHAIKDQQLLLAESTSQERLLALVSAGLGGLVLVLASLGIYGVLSYSVARRTGEIAIRMSLGALRSDVLRLVLREGSRVVCTGAAVGIAATWWSGRLLSAFLFEMKPLDPLTYAAAMVVLLGVAGLAAYLPAARAARIDPLVALRSD